VDSFGCRSNGDRLNSPSVPVECGTGSIWRRGQFMAQDRQSNHKIDRETASLKGAARLSILSPHPSSLLRSLIRDRSNTSKRT
jgi:hypothetical protein